MKLEFLPEKRFMERALELALEAEEAGEVPVGAVIVSGGQVIGEGRNRRESLGNALAHAEVEAIARACERLGTWRLSGCQLYVTLEPCQMCAGAAYNARVERVVFGAESPEAGTLKIPAYPGFMEDEARQILRGFFARQR